MKKSFLVGVSIAVAIVVSLTSCDRLSAVKGLFSSNKDYIENAKCGLDMKMIYVEKSSHYRSPNSGKGGALLEGYWIGECEVTQAQWRAIMGTTVYQQQYKNSVSGSLNGTGDDYPMYYVSWTEAQEFCRKLSKLTGKNYTLPTEAQWEYAARGGNKSRGYAYSGSDCVWNVAWSKENSYSSQPVKMLAPNELGLYDMSGNVYEWCGDGRSNGYTRYSYGSNCVIRGGCWRGSDWGCRVSYRDFYSSSKRYDHVGFRVVRVK